MSNINPSNIEENFPIAGQDNDTKTFRDNFASIVSNFEIAQAEISELENNVARVTTNNDFENNIIDRAIFRNCTESKTENNLPIEGADNSNIQLDFQSGSYHVLTIQNFVNVVISFLYMPGDPAIPTPAENAVGRMTLEIYSADDVERNISFTGTGGVQFKKSADFPTSFTVSSSTNPTFIEVWRHGGTIFMRYLGQFS